MLAKGDHTGIALRQKNNRPSKGLSPIDIDRKEDVIATRAEIIDGYFRSQDYYPHIPYEPVGEIIVQEVEDMGQDGLFVSTAAALVEKESGGKNVFGCDWGSKWTNEPPYCNVAVTEERVRRLIDNYNQPPVGIGANGVGYTQLTTMALVE